MLRSLVRITLRNPIQKWNILKHTEINRYQAVAPFHTTPIRAKDDEEKKLPPANPYVLFKEENATVILDMEDERAKLLNNEDEIEIVEEGHVSEFEQFSKTRGKNGVYDIDEFVEVLKVNHCQDIVVCSLPPELQWADHICIVTCRNERHMKAVYRFAARLYRLKKSPSDFDVKWEGKKTKSEWSAVDFGNIVFHIFTSKQLRKHYDLEMLWSVGSKYDPESNKGDPFGDLVEKHTIYLKGSSTDEKILEKYRRKYSH